MVIVISTQKLKAGHRETEIANAKWKGTGAEIMTVTVMWSNIKRAPADFESVAQDPFKLLSDPSTPSRWHVFVRIDKKTIKSTFERLLCTLFASCSQVQGPNSHTACRRRGQG